VFCGGKECGAFYYLALYKIRLGSIGKHYSTGIESLTLIIYIVFAAAAIIIVIIIMMVIIPSSEMTVYILLITLSQGLIDALLVSLEAY